MAAVMIAAWGTQRAVNNGGWVDVFWTFGSGAACVAAAMWPEDAASSSRQMLVAVLGAIWSLRLGIYVMSRVAGHSEDTRYAQFREEWGAKFQINMFWLVIVQAPATALLSVSIFVAAHGGSAELGWSDGFGAAILLIAIAGEGIADEQMRQFKKQGQYGAIMDKGLWAWSRHPNYFFEWLGWLAYPMIGFDAAIPSTWATWIAPVVMFIVLRFGTGVPALEKSMLLSRGDKFREYQSRVGIFIPLPPKRKAA